MDGAKRQRALDRAKRVMARVPGITGVDYGFRYVEEKRQRELCLRFHVARKLPLRALPAHEKLPKSIDGVPCDVVQAAYRPHASPRGIVNPIQPGVSIGNVVRQATGTLGGLVKDALSQKTAILSNWHVLCGNTACQPKDPISQPGPLHLGSKPPRVVAKLERWLPLDTGSDAAIALLTDQGARDGTVFDLGFAIQGIEDPVLGTALLKAGAVSGVTHALVDGVDGSFTMDYSDHGDKVRQMDGIRLVPDPDHPEPEVSLGGDSGSLWINPQTRRAVGLHFAGEDGLGPLADYAVAHPLKRIFQLLDLAGFVT